MERDIAVGERIRELRKAQGLTLRDVAGRTGYSYQTIATYEKGSRRVGVEQALRLAQALRCSLQDILGEDRADAFSVVPGVNMYNLPDSVMRAPCVEIRDPLAYVDSPAEADAYAALDHRRRAEESLEAARYMEFLAASYESVIALLDQCLGEGAGLIALRMLSAYARLSGPGRERCVEMMEDLSQIPRFRRT